MLQEYLKKYHIILGSASPRRKFLLEELGLDFEVRTKKTDETFPKKMKGKQIAIHLCRKKAEAFLSELKPGDLLITADTIVWLNNKILSKPSGYGEAVKMLKTLSGKTHLVHTAVSVSVKEKTKTFCVSTKVQFKKLSLQEINFYVRNYKPYDKAGAYGAQECLPMPKQSIGFAQAGLPDGLNPCSVSEKRFLRKINLPDLYLKGNFAKAGIEQTEIIKKISGSYFNVMGLPIKELYGVLMKF